MRSVFVVAIALALAAAYAPTLYWMGDRWLVDGSPYAHGPIVALAAAWIAVRRWRATTHEEPARGALALLAAGLGLHLLGLVARIDSVSGFSLPPVLVGLAGALGGRGRFRAWIAPAGFLLFAIPIPLQFVGDLSFVLKEASAAAALILARAAGLDVERTGPEITIAGGPTLLVGEACSGLRSLLAFGTLAYAYAFLVAERRTRVAAFLVALAIPLAFLANALRLFLLLAAVRLAGEKIVRGAAHEAAALPLYLGLFAAMVALDRRIFGRAEPPRPAASLGVRFRVPSWRVGLLVLAASAASVALALPRLAAPVSRVALDGFVPRTLLGLEGKDLFLSDRMAGLLETREVVYRRYEGEGEAVTLALVRGAGNRKTAHPPEVCYAGSGFDIVERGPAAIASDRGDRSLPARALTASGPGGRLVCVYLYLCGDRATGSYLRHQWDFFVDALSGRGGRSLLLRLDTFVPERETPAAARERLEAFGAALLPHLRDLP